MIKITIEIEEDCIIIYVPEEGFLMETNKESEYDKTTNKIINRRVTAFKITGDVYSIEKMW